MGGLKRGQAGKMAAGQPERFWRRDSDEYDARPMASATAGAGLDGLGREIVLGLLVERPDNCYQLDVRLESRFGAAGYARGMARRAVKRLVSEGFARPYEQPANEQGVRGSRDSMVFEATPAGVERFREWMWASVSTPPVREELHAKIALCRPTDLPRLIEVVSEAELVCKSKVDGLNFRLRGRRSQVDPRAWSARMDLAMSTGDQAWWESRIKWLQQVRVYLEKEWRLWQEQDVASLAIGELV